MIKKNRNFVSQYPAALRITWCFTFNYGEKVLQADQPIGLLHRGTEKLLEFISLI